MPKKSKNDPSARNKQSVKIRVCQICGAEGELGKKIQRVLVRNKLVWKCKDEHYG